MTQPLAPAPRPLRIAVVGHTNTGKTSLLRTLARDAGFGTVSDSPGTTRRVHGMALQVDGDTVVELFDTPGMEDAVALLEYLERLTAPGERLSTADRIDRFLDTPEARGRFEQEARTLRQLRDSDAALYVIDARDPVLAKHRDELDILTGCARPVLPVLNFVADPGNRIPQWRTALARLGLHAIVEFDSVAPALDGEQRLYDKLATLLDEHAPALERLYTDIVRQKATRRTAAANASAAMLIDVAALRLASAPDGPAVSQALDTLRERVRTREAACVAQLLALYRFRPDDHVIQALPALAERLDMDLFNPQALKAMGVRAGKSAAAGAAAGATLDVLSAGLSLGTGTLVGAAIGGLWKTADEAGARLLGRMRGHRELTVDDDVLRMLALRHRLLLRALAQRGHAAQAPLALDIPEDAALRTGPLPEPLRQARAMPRWCSMADTYRNDADREAAVAALAQQLDDAG